MGTAIAILTWFFTTIQPPLDGPSYARWLRGLARPQQEAVTAFCKDHPTSWERACGGIGPLHIPLPPRPEPTVRPVASAFATMEEWSRSLTDAQKAYSDRECPAGNGEDQPFSELCGGQTPLVVSFDDTPVEFRAGQRFAFQPGDPVPTDWPSDATPWIALDRDGDGRISSGAELFGNETPGGHINGFDALRTLDTNGDGVIDARDPAFASLLLWSSAGITPLSSTIVSISLADRIVPRCDARGNCEGERAPITWRDATGALRTGAVVDVYLR